MSGFGPFPDPSELLGHDEAADTFATMLDGGATDEQVTQFLIALSEMSTSLALSRMSESWRIEPRFPSLRLNSSAANPPSRLPDPVERRAMKTPITASDALKFPIATSSCPGIDFS